VRPHADLLHSKGVGVIGVEEDGATAWRSPPSAESTAEVTDIEGQLSPGSAGTSSAATSRR